MLFCELISLFDILLFLSVSIRFFAYSARFAEHVLEQGDIYKLLPAIVSLKKIMRGYRDEHTAVLTMPRPLADHEVKFYSTLFAQEFFGGDAKLDLVTLVDPSILGGYKLVIDDGEHAIDRSWSSELAGVPAVEDATLRQIYTVDSRLAPRSLF